MPHDYYSPSVLPEFSGAGCLPVQTSAGAFCARSAPVRPITSCHHRTCHEPDSCPRGSSPVVRRQLRVAVGARK